jgi:hypothetical protein
MSNCIFILESGPVKFPEAVPNKKCFGNLKSYWTLTGAFPTFQLDRSPYLCTNFDLQLQGRLYSKGHTPIVKRDCICVTAFTSFPKFQILFHTKRANPTTDVSQTGQWLQFHPDVMHANKPMFGKDSHTYLAYLLQATFYLALLSLQLVVPLQRFWIFLRNIL